MSAPIDLKWDIQVKPKEGDPEYFGRYVRLDANGILSISGYDGLTRLNEFEAKALAHALLAWARSRE